MPRKRSTWSARFSEPVDERVKRFTASVAFDRRLAKYDIQASIAHARMLAARIPRAKLEVVERAGHLLLWDEPERVAPQIGQFVGWG